MQRNYEIFFIQMQTWEKAMKEKIIHQQKCNSLKSDFPTIKPIVLKFN